VNHFFKSFLLFFLVSCVFALVFGFMWGCKGFENTVLTILTVILGCCFVNFFNICRLKSRLKESTFSIEEYWDFVDALKMLGAFGIGLFLSLFVLMVCVVVGTHSSSANVLEVFIFNIFRKWLV